MTPPAQAVPDHAASLTEQRLLWAERDVMRAEQRAQEAARQAEQAQALRREAEAALQAECRRSEALQAHLASLYASTSWKLSRPVRAAAKLQQLMQRLAGHPAAPVPQPPPQPAPQAPVPVPVAVPVLVLEARAQAMLNRLLGRV